MNFKIKIPSFFDSVMLIYLTINIAVADKRMITIVSTIVITALTCMNFLYKGNISVNVSRYIGFKICFIAWAALSLIWAHICSGIELNYAYSLVLKLMMSVSIIAYAERGNNVNKLLKYLIMATLVLAIRIVLSVPFDAYGTARIGLYIGSGEVTYGSTALTYIFGFASTLLLFDDGRIVSKNKYKWGLIILFVTFSLLSGSKKQFFFIAIALIVYSLYKSEKPADVLKNIVVAVIALILVLFLIMNNATLYAVIGLRLEEFYNTLFKAGAADLSTVGRMETMKLAWQTFIDNPFIGVGLDNFKYFNTALSSWAENNFLEILADFGMIGLAFYSIPHCYSLLSIRSGLKEKNYYAYQCLACIAIMLFVDITMVSYRDIILQLYLTIIYITAIISRKYN